MNQTSQFIFNIYHYLLNLRDTLEYALPREHELLMFEQRKKVLLQGLNEGSALGNFLIQNKENGEKIKNALSEAIDELYGDDSTVLKKAGDKIRVDHTQNLKIFEVIVGNSESVRDIVYGYLNFARSKGELEDEIVDLVKKDEVLYRTILATLVIREFEKSFAEFQKVMTDNKGKPSPQSNYIVQNEINKLSGFLRFSRQHCHATDNTTLDLLDDVNKVIEMCEGRRDRVDNKSFKDIFTDINTHLNNYLKIVEPAWKEQYEKVFKEMVELERNRKNQTPSEPYEPKA